MKQIVHTPKPPYAAFDAEDEHRLQMWAEEARHQLIKVALRSETISYSELWNKLLASDAGPAPKGLWRYRVGTLLYRVAKLNGKNHEPLLTALVVQKITGEVSEGYEDGVAACYGYSPTNITSHARSERIKIALWAGTDL